MGKDYPEHFLSDCLKLITVNYDHSEETTPMKGFAFGSVHPWGFGTNQANPE